MIADRGRRAPSMQDVATAAGVSHQTVSRVVNNEATIRAATRAKVEDAIAELGYRRNLAARALAADRTLAIGLIIPPGVDFGPTSMFHAIDRALRRHGYRPVIASSARDADSLRESIDFVLGQQVDGVIVIAPHVWAAEAIERARVRTPLVSIQTRPSSHAPSVSVDQRAGVRLLVEHLVSMGHVAVQHIAGPLDFQEGLDRAEAFDDAVAAHRIERGPRLAGDWSAASGFAAASQLSPATTAVVCGNDQMAFGLISGLRAAGRRVPEDVSVVGFDDTPESRYFSPPLTTVRQDFTALGELATRTLLARIDGRPDAVHAVLVPSLILRESSARPHTT